MKKVLFVLVGFSFLYGNQMNNDFTLMSNSFKHNQAIPKKYTCDGKNLSPHLRWYNIPKDTKSFALIVYDPDAPGKTWIHWLLFNIPSSVHSLPENIQNGPFISGITDFHYRSHGLWAYRGPCPPAGTHRYHFTLYALDTMLHLNDQATQKDLIRAMKGHVLGSTTLIGTYHKVKAL